MEVTAAVVLASLCIFAGSESLPVVRVPYQPQAITIATNVWGDLKIEVRAATYLTVIPQPGRRSGAYRIIEPEPPKINGVPTLPGPCQPLG